jgi:hypothetical protein
MQRTPQMLPVSQRPEKKNAMPNTLHLTRSFGPLLPATTVTPLLPLSDHLGHALHSLLPLLETALERALPELTLDPLANTRALHPQAIVNALLLLDLGVLRGVWHERQDIMGDREFEEFCLSAQGVVWCVPVSGGRVFEC